MAASYQGHDTPDGDATARRNALVLALAQALYFVGASILLTVGGLVGHLLADDKSLATLPVASFVLGTVSTTIPASLFMRRFGRRAGFQLGTTLALLSAMLAVYAIFERSFVLFCIATLVTGVYQAFAQYYRFAAADTASESFRPKAISWVLAGGLVAGVVGPQLVVVTKDLYSPVLYAGSFVAAAVAALLAIVTVSFVDIPVPSRSGATGEAPRPLREILKQTRLRVAILCGMVSYASMTFVMTATPLAMVACNHPVSSAANAIQWHLISMFAPSFFTGHLIARFGREPVVFTGFLLLGAAGLVAMSGVELWQFNLSLILLGLGWNLSYVGASTMVTDCHRPQERSKVQAVNEFMVFGLVSLASLGSGTLLHARGWETVAVSFLPAVVLAAGLVLVLALRVRSGKAASADA